MSNKRTLRILVTTIILLGGIAFLGMAVVPGGAAGEEKDSGIVAGLPSVATGLAAPDGRIVAIRVFTPTRAGSRVSTNLLIVGGERATVSVVGVDAAGKPVGPVAAAGVSADTNIALLAADHAATEHEILASHSGNTVITFRSADGRFEVSVAASVESYQRIEPLPQLLEDLYNSTGLSTITPGQLAMSLVGLLLIYLAIAKGFEPLLLVPIGFGALLSNIPIADIAGPNGLIGMVYKIGVETGVFPLLIFLGIGAMTDFGPMIANPKTALLGAAAQIGIFATVIGAVALNLVPGIEFSLKDAASIGIIGGADGPTAIFLTSRLSPHLLGSIAVAAYSYMALVPIIQPPIMRLLTTKKERVVRMQQLRHVSKVEKILFPIVVLILTILLLPDATPLLGMLMLGNLMKESGVVDRLSKTAQNELINIVTIFLGLAVGSKLQADQFLRLETLGIIVLGLLAFALGTAGGLFFGKIMCKLTGGKVNPLIGAAGVSAVPMAARVVNSFGLKADKNNYLLMHAMGPNVAGVIGSAVAAGILLAIFGN